MEKTDEPPYDHWYGYIVAICCFTGQFCALGCLNSYSIFIDSMSSDSSLGNPSTTYVAAVNSASNFIATVVATMLGPIADRYGPRRLYVLGAVFLFVGQFVGSKVNGYIPFAIIYAIVCGAASGCVVAPGLGALGGWFDKHRMLGMGLAYTGAGAGSAAIPNITTHLFQYYNKNWRDTMVWLSMAGIPILIAAIFIKPRVPPNVEELQSPELRMAAYVRRALISKRFMVMWFITFLNGYWFFTGIYCVIPYALAQGGSPYSSYDTISSTHASLLMLLFGILSCGGSILVGPITLKLGNRFTYVVVMLLAAATLLAMPFLHTFTALCIINAVFGYSSASVTTCMPGVCAEHFYGPRLGSTISILYTGFGTGGLLGPIITEAIVNAMGGSYTVPYLICGGMAVVGSFMVMFVIPKSSSELEKEQLLEKGADGQKVVFVPIVNSENN